MLTVGVVVALALGVYGQRLAGMLALDSTRSSERIQAVMHHVPIAILSAVIALQTFSSSGELILDARVAGVAAAALTAWRRLPIFVTVIVAPVVTALVRAAA